jgi:hypothetical protein
VTWKLVRWHAKLLMQAFPEHVVLKAKSVEFLFVQIAAFFAVRSGVHGFFILRPARRKAPFAVDYNAMYLFHRYNLYSPIKCFLTRRILLRFCQIIVDVG